MLFKSTKVLVTLLYIIYHVENHTSSYANHFEIENLKDAYSTHSRYGLTRPGVDDWASRQLKEGVIFYEEIFQAGHKFPLDPFIHEALTSFDLNPNQLIPNTWRVLLGFTLFMRQLGQTLVIELFHHKLFELSEYHHSR